MASVESTPPRKSLFTNQRRQLIFDNRQTTAFGFDSLEPINIKTKIQLEHDLEASMKALQKELHEQRLADLRYLAQNLKEDAWKYPPVEKLLEPKIEELKKKLRMATEDGVVLSYHDTLLRESDIGLLGGPHWINDNLIAFWFEYMEHEIYRDYAEAIAFVSPQVAHYVKAGRPEDLKDVLSPLQLSGKQLVLMPVNDCTAHDAPGGTHWSLLLYRSNWKVFEHYDSHTGSVNSIHAENMARALRPFVMSDAEALLEPDVYEMECTQQRNGYDCGLHVICNADAICRKYFGDDPRDITEIASPEAIARSRIELKRLIISLKRKASTATV